MFTAFTDFNLLEVQASLWFHSNEQALGAFTTLSDATPNLAFLKDIYYDDEYMLLDGDK